MRWILAKSLWLSLLMSFTPQSSAYSEGIEISGLVVDRTLTRFGKDFNFYYSSYWRDLPYTQGYNVTLTETVFPQAGTLLLLEINGKAIYKTHFGRRISPVEEKAKEAMLVTLDYIAHARANEMTGGISQQFDGF